MASKFRKVKKLTKFKVKIAILKIINSILNKFQFYLLPDFSKKFLRDLTYSNYADEYFFAKPVEKISVMKIETSNYFTAVLGLKFQLCS